MGRVDNFIGTSRQYTIYLEKRIKNLQHQNALLRCHCEQLRFHHDQCQWNRTVQKAPTTTTSPCESIARPWNNSQSLPQTRTPPPESNNASPLDKTSPFIIWDAACSKQQSEYPRWKQEATQLIHMTPTGAEWWRNLSKMGFNTAEEWYLGLEFLLETNMTVPTPANRPLVPVPECGVTNCNCRSSEKYQVSIQRTRAYAHSYQARDQVASFTSAMVNYQQFILVAICIVLRHQGVCGTTVDHLMRVAIADTTSRYINRLEKAVKWVISLANELKKDWGYRATGLPVIWQKPPSYYVRFAETPTESLAYLTKALCSQKFIQDFQPRSWTPYSLPFIVDQVLQKSIPLVEITEALGSKDLALVDADGFVILQHPWRVWERR